MSRQVQDERRRRKKRQRKSLKSRQRRRSEREDFHGNSSVLNDFHFRHDSAEEGELESDHEMMNPMVTVTKIDPSEIPEVSHKFLMRGRRSRSNEREGDRHKDRDSGFGWSKKSVPQSRSGRTIKGRGNFRYRTPSRSRSRSFTPEHWKAAQRNVIKITDFERLEEQKKTREAEMDRRAEERKKRHDAIVKGDGKKSFFELAQDAPEAPVITIASSLTRPEKSGSVDLNALDYEDSGSEREVRENIKTVDEKSDKNGKGAGSIKPRSDRNRSRSRGSLTRRSRSRDRFNRDKKDFRPAQRNNRFNDNRRWDNPRSFNRSRIDNERWSHSRNRTNSRSRSRSR